MQRPEPERSHLSAALRNDDNRKKGTREDVVHKKGGKISSQRVCARFQNAAVGCSGICLEFASCLQSISLIRCWPSEAPWSF